MRIRRKPWARPELEACPFFERDPEKNRGKWASLFKEKFPIRLELGCGKGIFISALASTNLNFNYVGIDIKDEMLGLAKRNIEKEYSKKNLPIENVLLTAFDISRINKIFSEEDLIDRIYINFCNPWPRSKHKKRRLTHTRQLVQYRIFLKDKGQIFFKTDDDDLFNESLKYFDLCGYKIIYKVYDIKDSNFSENIETEHEKMFKEMGKTIKFLIAEKYDEFKEFTQIRDYVFLNNLKERLSKNK